MAKQVSSEDSESTFQSESEKMQNFADALDNLRGSSYSSGLQEMESSISSAKTNMTNWAPDDVQTKLSAFITELDGARGSIESDITGGSFLSLTNTAKQLVTELSECKNLKKTYENAKTAYANAVSAYQSAQYSYTHATPEDKDAAKRYKDQKESAKDSAERTKNAAKKNLDNKVTSANNHFKELSQFTFSASGSGNNSGGNGGNGGNDGAPAFDRAAAEAKDRQSAIEAYMKAHPEATQAEAEAAVDAENKKAPYDLIARKYGDEAAAAAASAGKDGNFKTYEGSGDPNGVLVQTTYQVTDPDSGEPITMNLLVNTETGNMAYGNDDVGYYVTCITDSGDIQSGFTTKNAPGLEGAATVITDGHENASGSNKWFGISPYSTYGFGETVNPEMGLNRSWDNCHDATITVNGQNISVVLPNSGGVLAPYSPAALCDSGSSDSSSDSSSGNGEGFGGATGGGGRTAGGGAGRGRH